MKVLVINGSCFFGRYVTEAMLDDFHNVFVYDKFSNYEDVPKDVTIVDGEISERSKLVSAMSGFDAVVYIPRSDMINETVGIINIVNSCVETNVRRLIVVSSGEVYGRTKTPSKEIDITDPVSYFGISKTTMEMCVKISGLNYTILRISKLYGPGGDDVVSSFVTRAKKNENIIVFGDGTQTYDFVHARDASRFITEVLSDRRTFKKIYNVSSGIGISIRDIAKMIDEKTKAGIIYEYVEEGKTSELVDDRLRKKNELKYLVLDNKKAIADVLWRPRVTFSVGLFEMMDLHD